MRAIGEFRTEPPDAAVCAARFRRWRRLRVATPPRRRRSPLGTLAAGLALTLLAAWVFLPLAGLILLATLAGVAFSARAAARGGERTVRGGWFGACPSCGVETVLEARRGAADQPFACHACGAALAFRRGGRSVGAFRRVG